MVLERWENRRLILFLLALTILTLAPILSVERFVIQDGSAHVNTAFVMGELLKGNGFFSSFYEFNSPFVPNSGGHWLMVFLLQFFSPFAVTKILASLTFIALPLSVLWFERQVAGGNDPTTVYLLGCAAAFNWFWLMGAFNFMLGLAGFVFTLGLYWRWRETLNLGRSLTIVVLLSLVFFNHLIGFLLLTGSIFFVALFTKPETRKNTLLWTLPIVVTAITLFTVYKIEISSGGEGFFPVWRSLADVYSLRSWISQLTTVDPFVIISRKTLPFTSFNSPVLVAFAPILWIGLAISLMLLSTLRSDYRRQVFTGERFPFLLLALATLILALFGPDDFNLSNGSLLRPRLLIAALVFAIPLLVTSGTDKLKLLARLSLLFVVVFQVIAVWEFALRSNHETRDLAQARDMIADGQYIASTVIIEDAPRFYSYPAGQMVNYLGTGKNVIVLDNYEMGYNLFPLVVRDSEMRKFTQSFTASSVLYLNNPLEEFDTDLKNLDFNLSVNFGRIDVLVLYGRNEAVEAVIKKTFGPHAFFESDNIRLFQRIK